MNYPDILAASTLAEKKFLQKAVRDGMLKEKAIVRIINSILSKNLNKDTFFLANGTSSPNTERTAITKLVSILDALRHIKDTGKNVINYNSISFLLTSNAKEGFDAADTIIIHHLLIRLFSSYSTELNTNKIRNGIIKKDKHSIDVEIVSSSQFNSKIEVGTSITDYILNNSFQSHKLFLIKLPTLQSLTLKSIEILENYLLKNNNLTILVLSVMHTEKGSGWKLEYINSSKNSRNIFSSALSTSTESFNELANEIAAFVHPMTTPEIYRSNFDLRSKVRKNSHICYNPSCSTGEDAIESHVLQENGTLDAIAENTPGGLKIAELKLNNNFEEGKTGHRYGFNEVGIGSGNELTFWGFCEKCDRELFSDIEVGSKDLTNVRNQLLLSYRAYLNELFKQEYNVLFHIAIRADMRFPQNIKDQTYIPRQAAQATTALIGYSEKLLLEAAIANPDSNTSYKFIHFILPKVEVATSATFTSGLKIKVDVEEALKFRPDYKQVKSISPILQESSRCFLHLIPRANHLEVIIGYSTNTTHIISTSVDKIESLSEGEKFKLISDILITRIETWCISLSFHKLLHESDQEEKVLSAIDYHLPFERKNEPVKANLFKVLNLF